MKKIDGFQCENCKVIHPTAQEAEKCERHHRERLAGIKIMGGHFKNPEGTWGFGREQRIMYPQTINIRFSDGYGDFAEYTLSHVGYRGL